MIKSYKLVLILLLSLIFQLGMSQEMYLKSVTNIRLPIDTVYSVEQYYYNGNWKLDSVTFTKPSGARSVQHYRNDTLIDWVSPERTLEYVYFSDSVIQYNITSNSIKSVLYTDVDLHVIALDLYILPDYIQTDYYTWENENIIAQDYLGGHVDYTYYDDILNPRYNKNSMFKVESFNYLSSIKAAGSPYEYIYFIDEAINSYPLIVTRFQSGNTPIFRSVFEYDIISEVQENLPKEEIVLSIKYYNILGQEIEKPRQGFYIERKHTTKGMFSKKYNIK